MKDTSDLKAWYREDLRNLLAGLDYVCSQPGMSEERRAGFLDALTAIALAVGIELPDIWQRTDAIIEAKR